MSSSFRSIASSMEWGSPRCRRRIRILSPRWGARTTPSSTPDGSICSSMARRRRPKDLAERLPSSQSRDFGRPFAQLFREFKGDFYAIDPLLFSPAEVIVTRARVGPEFSRRPARHGHARPVVPWLKRSSRGVSPVSGSRSRSTVSTGTRANLTRAMSSCGAPRGSVPPFRRAVRYVGEIRLANQRIRLGSARRRDGSRHFRRHISGGDDAPRHPARANANSACRSGMTRAPSSAVSTSRPTSFLIGNAGISDPRDVVGGIVGGGARESRGANCRTVRCSETPIRFAGTRIAADFEHRAVARAEVVAGVYYLQRFVGAERDGFRDMRLLVSKGRVVAAMVRHSDSWITNIKQGGRPIAAVATARFGRSPWPRPRRSRPILPGSTSSETPAGDLSCSKSTACPRGAACNG